MFKTPIIRDDKNRGRNIKWAERRCFHKGGRIIYKACRAFYVSVVYYMIPFSTMLFPFFLGFPYKWIEQRPAPTPEEVEI